MDDEELFRRIQARKGQGRGVSLNPADTPDYRREAGQLLRQIQESGKDDFSTWQEKDRRFVHDLITSMAISPTFQPTQNQIFWLRDIRDRLCT